MIPQFVTEKLTLAGVTLLKYPVIRGEVIVVDNSDPDPLKRAKPLKVKDVTLIVKIMSAMSGIMVLAFSTAISLVVALLMMKEPKLWAVAALGVSVIFVLVWSILQVCIIRRMNMAVVLEPIAV